MDGYWIIFPMHLFLNYYFFLGFFYYNVKKRIVLGLFIQNTTSTPTLSNQSCFISPVTCLKIPKCHNFLTLLHDTQTHRVQPTENFCVCLSCVKKELISHTLLTITGRWRFTPFSRSTCTILTCQCIWVWQSKPGITRESTGTTMCCRIRSTGWCCSIGRSRKCCTGYCWR